MSCWSVDYCFGGMYDLLYLASVPFRSTNHPPALCAELSEAFASADDLNNQASNLPIYYAPARSGYNDLHVGTAFSDVHSFFSDGVRFVPQHEMRQHTTQTHDRYSINGVSWGELSVSNSLRNA